MNVQRVVLPLIAALFLVGCGDAEIEEEPAFTHPVSIQLQPEKTIILLSDYLVEYGDVKILSCPDGLDCFLMDGDSILIEVSTLPQPLGILSLETFGSQIDFLIKRSEKKKVEFKLADPEAEFSSVSVVGDINSWNPEDGIMEFEDGLWKTVLWVNPGTYGYQFEVDGERILDPQNPEELDNSMGGFNSLLSLESPDYNELPHIHTFRDETGSFSIKVDGNYRQLFALMGGRSIELSADQNGAYNIELLPQNYGLSDGFMLVQAANELGAGPDLLIPVKNGAWVLNPTVLSPEDWHRTTMYFLMVDRFINGDPDNDRIVEDERILPIANYFGGDLAGVNQAIIGGYFRELNMNSIWLSPIVQNPEGAYGFWDKGGVQSMFSGYHGYWPVSFTRIDDRFGTEDDLERMVSLINQYEMTLLLDLVANHVHEKHPFYRENKDRENFFTDLYLPDGSLNTERWDDHRLTTWFDTFMPTMELRNPEVAEVVSDSAVFWLERFGVHGFRHDATKHVPLSFWRMLTKKINELSANTGRNYLQIGETYGSPELISSYISPGMLNSQFDFNVYDAVINSVIRPEIPMSRLAERLLESQKYYGTNHLMGNMSGNQDKPRIMSLATGEVAFDEDSKLAGWTRDINKTNEVGFARVGMIHAINFFIPGIPVVYYGDEIGVPGGNDPDNRRMMQFEDLDEDQENLKDMVSRLAYLRNNRMEFIYGDFRIWEVGDETLLASRNYFSDKSWLLLNSGDEPVELILTWSDDYGNPQFFNHREYEKNDESILVHLPARSFEIISTENQSYQ